MVLLEVAPDVYSLNILINCFCNLNQMGFSLSVLGKILKLGFEPDITTLNTLIKGFLHENRIAEATQLWRKLGEEGNCMEREACKPNAVVYSTIIDSL